MIIQIIHFQCFLSCAETSHITTRLGYAQSDEGFCISHVISLKCYRYIFLNVLHH